MFPGPYAEVYRNEEGEILGWDNHYNDAPEWCEVCGLNGHNGSTCTYDWEPDDEG